MRKSPALLTRLGAVAVLAILAGGTSGAGRGQAASPACVQQHVTSAYAAEVRRVLRSGPDEWGNVLLHSRAGPTYEGAARYLKPLMLAAAPGRGKLTDSGVYYLPFGLPAGGFGANSVALHVADGSELIADRTNGPKLTISVGANGTERYGSCLSRLSAPQLFDGYLPILDTQYVDSGGVRYQQESFATRTLHSYSLMSFVRLTVDARRSAHAVRVRLRPSATHLELAADNRLVHGDATYLYLSDGARFDGSSATYTVPAHTLATVYAGWLVEPMKSKPFPLDETGFLLARQALVDLWTGLIWDGATIEVPDERVQNAERSLLIQTYELAWRYSIGNTYEQISAPETIDVAQVMGEYGFQTVDQAILRTSFWRQLSGRPNWNMGANLLGSARYYLLFHDRAYLEAHTPILAQYVATLGTQLAANGGRLLPRQPYSSDIAKPVFGLHAQAEVWDGLRSMARAWGLAGHPQLAQRARDIAARLGAGLAAATRKSTTKLPDGSLFVPVRLVDGEKPYQALTATRPGSYWNLVVPYALASGLFKPQSPQAKGVLKYMLEHGSRLLGLVRAGAYSLYGRASSLASGTDQVYGVNMARFLADNDQPDQLVLSLYGQLAAGMTQGTFVAGEAASIAPVAGEYYRKMYLPPNGGSNAAFLETLRLMLIHETEDATGVPQGLELAFATPRAWLGPGKQISVDNAPTSFGRLSYSIEATKGSVRASLDVPKTDALRVLELRLRLPAGERLTGVTLGGRPLRRFDPATGTIDLSGHAGRLTVEARYVRR